MDGGRDRGNMDDEGGRGERYRGVGGGDVCRPVREWSGKMQCAP